MDEIVTERKHKILVIDDDEAISALINAKLPLDKFEISYAETGEAGLAYLRDQNFDLVLLDLNLPGASGISILRGIRADFNQFELPILMVTASEDPEDLLEAFKNGANDYISKSVSWNVKLARIETQIELKCLHRDATRLRELKAINALVTTYNHEIINPLSTTWGAIRKIQLDERFQNVEDLERVVSGLERIKTVVKKIEKVLETQVEYESYSSQGSKMIKLGK